MLIQEWLGNDNVLGMDIWNKKYRFKNESLDEWFKRVSGGNGDVEEIIKERKFLYAGRILSNRGLNKYDRKVTLSNCYVITPPDDNLESIFSAATKLARTYSYGGGCGIDISNLAPRGAKVNNASKFTTGAVSFMDLYSLVTGMIGQNGRRGALMISIDCNHPDLEEFIDVKNDLTRVTKANVSVRFTDKFMKAVKNNEEFELTFYRSEVNQTINRKVNARNIFMKLAKNNWSMAEPGCLFWDTINEWNMLSETAEFSFAGVNPCSEEPLNAGGSCLLGSINLAAFVRDEFTDKATFDFDSFARTVKIAIIGLNETLDEGLPLHPLEEQRIAVKDWRQIGLGIMGLADMYIKMGIKYGSPKSLELSKKISALMIETAIHTSAILAKETGAYPKCDKEAILKTRFLHENATAETIELVKNYGLKNSQILTIAPTGSIGSMLGISTGIEPIFANAYTRKTETLYDKDTYYKVYTPIVEQYMKKNGISKEEDLPDYFVTASTLNYKSRIDMQAVWQRAIDASISSTVNVPEEFSIEDTFNLYLYAWENKLKGVTIFRENCDRVGILTTENSKVKVNSTHNREYKRKKLCPECGGEVHSSGGCLQCASCGWAVCE